MILLMIEAPKNSDAVILGIATNEKEAQKMADVAKKSNSVAVRIIGYEIESNRALTFNDFTSPKFYAGV